MPLRGYQEAAVSAAFNHIKYRSSHGYVAAPCGSGKSWMIAELTQRIYDKLGLPVIIITDSEKLLRQNREKISPNYPVGVYCAGIGEKDLTQPITMATIQSLSKTPPPDRPTVVIVDESHMVPPESDDEGMYWSYISAIPEVRLIGFTATPFRTQSGKLNWGDEIINVPLMPLINDGFVVPPNNKAPIGIDTAPVTVRMGEFVQNQLEELFLDEELLQLTIEKILKYGKDRKHCLIFCQSRKHMQVLQASLDDSVAVDGDTPKKELEATVQAFEQGEFKYLLNVQLMTKGTDIPCLDMVTILRSTVSKGLFEQMAMRGSRPFEGKKDFLLLDMGGNLVRHGAIGSPPQGGGTKTEKVGKAGLVCPECEGFTPRSKERICISCGYEFLDAELRKVDHERSPDTKTNVVWSAEDATQEHTVFDVSYSEHIKRGTDKRSLKIDYDTSHGTISEWIAPWSDNDWAKNKAWEFFRDRGKEIHIDDKDDISFYDAKTLLSYCEELKKPSKITVDHGGKYTRIKGYDYGEESGSGDTEGVGALDDDFIPF